MWKLTFLLLFINFTFTRKSFNRQQKKHDITWTFLIQNHRGRPDDQFPKDPWRWAIPKQPYTKPRPQHLLHPCLHRHIHISNHLHTHFRPLHSQLTRPGLFNRLPRCSHHHPLHHIQPPHNHSFNPTHISKHQRHYKHHRHQWQSPISFNNQANLWNSWRQSTTGSDQF